MLHLHISLVSNKYCYTYCVEIKYTYSQQTLAISRKRNIWVNENDIITAQAVWKQRIGRFYEIFAWQVATFFKVNIIILLILIHMYIYIIRISLYLPLSMRMNIKKTTCRQSKSHLFLTPARWMWYSQVKHQYLLYIFAYKYMSKYLCVVCKFKQFSSHCVTYWLSSTKSPITIFSACKSIPHFYVNTNQKTCTLIFMYKSTLQS